MTKELSIILPAKNEAQSLQRLLPELQEEFPDAEILVVNDGSTDNTEEVCAANGVRVVSHRQSKGNGGAVKAGARAATGRIFLFMDADGQHKPADIHLLIQSLESGHDMAIGARTRGSQASVGRGIANTFYNWFATRMTNQSIPDLTSGFRAVIGSKFREFLYLLPNGFSYPTTITMAFFRAGYSVDYIPIVAEKREGKSHIRPIKDGIRFLIIIFKVATLYSPLKVFVPSSGILFLMGIGYYLYTYITASRFTNMGALLLTTAFLVFLIGLVSEQITCLIYKDSGQKS
jgi:glycosyltransferase involved in cell wall biosynthesis